MAKTKTKTVSAEPVVIRGSHSIRTEYPDGRVEFESNWEELKNDVNAALAEYAKTNLKDKPKTEKKKAEPKSKIIKAMETTLKDAEKSLNKKSAKKPVAKKTPAKKTAVKAKKTK